MCVCVCVCVCVYVHVHITSIPTSLLMLSALHLHTHKAVFFVNNNSISMYDMDTGMVTVLLSNNGSPILDLVLDPVDENVFFCTEKSIMKLYRSAGLVMEVVSVRSPRVITVYNRYWCICVVGAP